MRLRRTLALTLLAAAASAALFTRPGSPQPSRNFSVSSASTPAPTTDERDYFDRVRAFMNGVEGFYPTRVTKGCAAVGGGSNCNPFNRTWFPFRDANQIACGSLRQFAATDLLWSCKSEMDWNIYLAPSAPFRSLLKRGESRLEAEVTPDESFFDNEWFPREGGGSALLNKNLCVCGPFVRDENHDDAHEIHPSQVIWWEDGGDARAEKLFFKHFLLVMQDDSDRFDDDGDFDCHGFGDNIPAGFEPWARAPIVATFRIAFLVYPPRSPLQARFFTPMKVRVTTLFRRLVVTDRRNERFDADDGTQHVLEYDGRPLVVVDEAQAADDDIGVQFVEIRKRQDGGVQGYVQLATAVGDTAASDNGGYHLINAEVTPGGGIVGPLPDQVFQPPPCKQQRKRLASVRADLKNLRAEIRRTRAEFTRARRGLTAPLFKELNEMQAAEQTLVEQEGRAEVALGDCRR